MNKITLEQANIMMDTICEKTCNCIGHYGGMLFEDSDFNYLEEKVRECFVAICETLEINEVQE